jgi:uncharacterized membrane protein
MTQEEINRSEWNNLKNWSAMIYRSQLDSRLFVPKRTGFGTTINFGHPKYGKALLVSVLFASAIGILCSTIAIFVLMKFGWKK